jgi:poly(3-hydroxyalkanoate) depolymerase
VPAAHRAFEAHISSIDVGGQRVRVAIQPGRGDGRPLLLLNGIGANLEMLQPFVDALDAGTETIRVDLPGTGGSSTPSIPYRFPGLASLIAQLLDQLGYPEVDLLGISWGGALAQQFAYQYPTRCRRLVLVSTATGTIMVPGCPAVLARLATPRRYRDPDYLATIAAQLYGGRLHTNPELAASYGQTVRSGGTRGYYWQLLGSAGWTSIFWLHRLRQPTLILSGTDDPIVPLVNAQIMACLIPNSSLHVFDDGHLGLLTSADELAPVVQWFLTAPADELAGHAGGPFDAQVE